MVSCVHKRDIDKGIKNKILKFADDTKLCHAISCDQVLQQLQSDIEQVQNWSEKWQMQFNVDKCKRLHIGHNNNKYKYTMNGQEIESSVRERDLGVQIGENLDSEAQVGKAVTRANKILGMIWRTYDKSMKNIIQLYKSLVRPHLDYAMQIWNPYKQKHVDLLEEVQRRATTLIDKLRHLTEDEPFIA